MQDGTPGARPNRVNALMRGLMILRMFSDEQQSVSVSEMARQLDVHRSNASRLAATLHELGFLRRSGESGQYQLGPQLIRLGQLAAQDNDVVQQAMEPLRTLVAETGETGHIGVLDGSDAVTAAVVDGWHTVRMHSYPSKRSPAHCSSLGKALLSGLDDQRLAERYDGRPLPRLTPNSISSFADLRKELELVRTHGYAVDNQEVELNLRCVAAPILGTDGSVVASLGLSGPASRLTEEEVHQLARKVRTAAAQATGAIGGRLPPTSVAEPPLSG